MRTLNTAQMLLAVALLLSGGVIARADTSSRPQVVGGGDVPDPNPYTYQVSIGTADTSFCGGSLIAADWVLSASHCFVDQVTGGVTDAATLVVYVGLRSLNAGFSTPSTTRLVSQLIVHPDYDRENSTNDIALLHLTTPVEASWVVPLASSSNGATLTAPGTQSIATGWGGLLGYDPSTGGPAGGQQYPDILQVVQMPIVDNTTCGINPTQLCAGLAEGGVDTCQGDSGGPLVVSDGAGGYIQVGVVSNGEGCAAPSHYGVYTRVSSYNAWINSLVSPTSNIEHSYLPVVMR